MVQIAISGAGISGLALGCACAMRGLEVAVFEQANALGEIGAGLQISPNGWHVLDALGVAEALAPLVFEPPEIEMRLGQSGRRIWRLEMGQVARARWNAPYMQVHRADLAHALATRLEALAPGSIHTGARVSGYDKGRLLLDGQSIDAKVVVGADGLHSVIRTQMLGPDDPVYTGNVAWRALVPVEVLGTDAPPANATIWAGNGRHAVTTRLRGGSVVNVVGMVETPDPGPEGWRITGEPEDVLPLFDGWARPVTRVLEAAQDLHRWALFARTPLPRWSDATAILIGDAAHPMLPSFAQGAVQGLEDAWSLAAELARSPDATTAGARVYAARIDRVSQVQKQSVGNARMFHRAGPLGTPVYYGGMALVARLAPGVLRQRQDWVYGLDVVTQYPL